MKSKDLKCNTPVKSWRKNKKFAVLACDNGKSKLLHFGDSRYDDYTQHKDKKRRKSFRARHKCDSQPADKLSAKYWSCKKLW